MENTYIPTPDYLLSMYSNPQFNGRWVVVKKVPISNIKIDKTLFSYQNEVDWNNVDYICTNFEVGGWFPIMVNQKYFLLDGQHRLAVARKMKYKYIDVVVDNGDDDEKNAALSKRAKKSKLVRLMKL